MPIVTTEQATRHRQDATKKKKPCSLSRIGPVPSVCVSAQVCLMLRWCRFGS